MNLLNAFLHLPALLAQADSPAAPTDSPDATPLPDFTPSSSPIFTMNGQPATPEQIAHMKSLGMVGGLIGLLVGLLFIVAMWRIFTKAGKPGWASIIPIYNIVVLLEIAGRPVWWFILLFIPFVNFIILIIVMIDLAKSFGYGVGFALGLIFLSPIFILILAFGSARYVGPGGRGYAGGYPPGNLPPGGYPPATM